LTSAAPWFKSSYSNGAASCIEVRFVGDVVQIRDTKFRRDSANTGTAQPTLQIDAANWRHFLAAITS
jgi:hypothetical protein